jgi:hypothetical protein
MLADRLIKALIKQKFSRFKEQLNLKLLQSQVKKLKREEM